MGNSKSQESAATRANDEKRAKNPRVVEMTQQDPDATREGTVRVSFLRKARRRKKNG